MKATLFLLFVCTLMTRAQAQFAKDHSLYINTSTGIGKGVGGLIGLNYTYQQKYSLQVTAYGFFAKPPGKPDDYSSGLIGLTLFGLLEPIDEQSGIGLLAGKVWNSQKTKTIKYHVRAGPTYSRSFRVTNWQRSNGGGIGPNYTFEKRTFESIGMLAKAQLEWSPSRYFGFHLGAFALINNSQQLYGLELGYLFGFIRDKKQ